MNRGEFIKTRRNELKITQAELSSFLHITPQGLSNYENDKTKIPLSLVLDFCYYLKLSINDFFLLTVSEEEIIDLTKYNFDYVSNNLAFYREKYKLTLKELSKQVNISIKRLSEFELNKASPSIEEFITISSFYKISYEDFFLNKENEEKDKEKEKEDKKESKSKFKLSTLLNIILCALLLIILPITIFVSISKNVTSLPSSAPVFNDVSIKSDLNSKEELTKVTKGEKVYLIAYINNSYNYKITSLTINNVIYKENSFDKESSNQKVILSFDTSSLTLGSDTINFEYFSYITNDEKEHTATIKNKSITLKVLSPQKIKARFDELSLGPDEIMGNFEILNDEYNLVKGKKCWVYLSNNSGCINKILTDRYFKFSGLKIDATYTLEVKIQEDLFDGNGTYFHTLISQKVSTSSLCSIYNVIPSFNSVKFQIIPSGYVGVTFKKLYLIDDVTKNKIFESEVIVNNISSLYSNHPYTLKCEMMISSETKTYSYSFKTLEVEKPDVYFNYFGPTEDTISFEIVINNRLDSFKFNYIKLTNNKNNEVIKVTKEETKYTFNNLLSNTSYTITFNYSYDLLDGNGEKTENYVQEIKTHLYGVRYLDFKSYGYKNNTIMFELNVPTYTKPKITYIKTELIEYNLVIDFTSSTKHTFYNIVPNRIYTLNIIYTIDYNDGNGPVDSNSSYAVPINENGSNNGPTIEDLRPQ